MRDDDGPASAPGRTRPNATTRPGPIRRRLARWLDPTSTDPTTNDPTTNELTEVVEAQLAQRLSTEPWPDLCEQFALRILAAAYQTARQLAEVERDEQDPQRLERLYRIDHATARMRRQAENLLVLAGRTVDDAGRQVTSLVDVIRAASSSVEQYWRIRIGPVTHLAVFDLGADDVIRVLTELLDNATRFSPPTSVVAVSAHLTETGSVLVRVEDLGPGAGPNQLAALNALLSGEAPESPPGASSSQLGLRVVRRLARARQLRVRLDSRAGGGTIASVLVPGTLLCETPHPSAARHALGDAGGAASAVAPVGPAPVATTAQTQPPAQHRTGVPGSGAHLSLVGRRSATPTHPTTRVGPSADPGNPPAARVNGLPQRQPISLRDLSAVAPPREPVPPPAPGPVAAQAAWPDETGDFAAGFVDGLQASTGSPSSIAFQHIAFEHKGQS